MRKPGTGTETTAKLTAIILNYSKLFLCSLVVDLLCQGCHSVIGMVYASTPKNLDHKRFTFCLNVADIDRYVWARRVNAIFL